ncbi:MAG: SAV_915 family protein [Planctomycetaceae bacterium]
MGSPPGTSLIPPVVYLPCAKEPDGLGALVELRPMSDGRTALLVYTALDRLADCCGPHQPWVLYRTDQLHELGETQPYDVIYADIAIPAGFRHTSAGAQS